MFLGRVDEERGHGAPPCRRGERDFIIELNLPRRGKFNGDPKTFPSHLP